MDIGKYLKEIREKADLSQTELANIFGMTKAQLSQYETGKRTPKKNTISRMAYIVSGTLENADGSTSPVLIAKLESLQSGLDELEHKYYIDPYLYKPWSEMDDETNNDEKQAPEKTVTSQNETDDKSEHDLLKHYRKLNDGGKEKVVDFAEDLTKIPEYRSDTQPE